ncbi:hypothetical protein C21_02639 [Arenibacter sp. NBRC 103722]|nr:hypothetical protein C21_02639 [Arenibacter sp. NBRC 103722]
MKSQIYIGKLFKQNLFRLIINKIKFSHNGQLEMEKI